MSNENKPIANSIKEQTYYKGKTAEVRKWAFASGELVYNLPWMLISSFLAFFMTDIALIPAQTVAILFLVCRIWDAVNDPMIGSMADRTKSKMGRYRPWMLGGAVCLMPIVVLLFTAHPSWSVGARTTYACVLYALAVIAATAWNIPFSALNGVISPYPNERASFSSHRIFVSSIACAATNAMFLPLVNRFSEQGGKTQGYSMAALTICLLTVPFIFTSILGTKEVVKAPPSQKMGTKQVLGNFFKNPPLLIVCTAFLVYGFLNYGRMTAGMYYFTYFWGDSDAIEMITDIDKDPSLDVRRFENEISRVLDSHSFDKNILRKKILECVSLKYKDIDSQKYTSKILKADFANASPLSAFSMDLFNRTVKAIKFSTGGAVSIILLNDQQIGKEQSDDTNSSNTTEISTCDSCTG